MPPNHPNRSKRGDAPGRNPRPEEVRALRLELGITQRAAAELVHSSEVSWQQWEESPDKGRSRRMHPAMWTLFRLRVGKIQLNEI